MGRTHRTRLLRSEHNRHDAKTRAKTQGGGTQSKDSRLLDVEGHHARISQQHSRRNRGKILHRLETSEDEIQHSHATGNTPTCAGHIRTHGYKVEESDASTILPTMERRRRRVTGHIHPAPHKQAGDTRIQRNQHQRRRTQRALHRPNVRKQTIRTGRNESMGGKRRSRQRRLGFHRGLLQHQDGSHQQVPPEQRRRHKV